MKLVRRFAVVILLLALLCGYSWAIKHVSTGGRGLGPLTGPLRAFAGFPDEVARVMTSQAIRNIPDSYVQLPPDFKPVNELEHDLFGLHALWNDAEGRWDVQLLNFRNDSVVHRWTVGNEGWVLNRTGTRFANALAFHGLLMEDRSLIAKLDQTPNLFRLDAGSNVVWANHELIFHHSIQPAIDGNIWACTSDLPAKPGGPRVGRRLLNLNGKRYSYQEDYVTKLDARTGRVLYKKGVGAIMVENGLEGILFSQSLRDPFHLNDISPVTTDGPYWKRGDLFLSARNRSIVMLYRPSADSVLRVISGPLLNQHDVNIISDHEISIFNNRAAFATRAADQPEDRTADTLALPIDSLNHSEVIIYDFATSSFRSLYRDQFKKEGIKCLTQGLDDLLPNGELFVESPEQGIYFVLDSGGVVMRKVIPTPLEGYVHAPSWTRTYLTLP